MFTSHTYYSLRYGTMSPEQLVTLAKKHGIEQLALADINNVTAMPEFVRLCRQHGIRPVAGIEFRRGHQLLYIVLARNPEGFASMNRFLSHHNIGRTPLPDHYPVCENTLVIYPFNRLWPDFGAQGSKHQPEVSGDGNVFAGIQPDDLTRLLTSPLRHHPEKLLALYPITFASESDYELHRYLRAIDHNIVLSHLQPHQMASPREVMTDRKTAFRLYDSLPQLPVNTETLIGQCEMDFDFRTPKNKKTFTGHPADDRALLHKLAIDGLEYRYGKIIKKR
jgi:DNA polymerase III alpha subunit